MNPGEMAHASTLPPGFVKLVEDARRRIVCFTLDEFLARLQAGERYILIDVRELGEYSRGHLPGAHHLSRGVLEREIERAIPEREAAIVLYSGGGSRSALAADSLQRMGYTNVASLDGGCREWMARGLPTAKPGA